jgi:hypothetical protein
MPPYCKSQSAFRPVAFGISAVAAGTTVTLVIHATEWMAHWYVYILVGVILWIFCAYIFYKLLGPINRFLIRTFGKEEIKKRQNVIATEIVKALFDRRPALELPEEDDDLITREAALTFISFFVED